MPRMRKTLLAATALLATTLVVVTGPAAPAGAAPPPTPGPRVAIRGLDDGVWVRTAPDSGTVGDLSAWYSLGGQTVSAPAMSRDTVVVRGLDNQIWVRRNVNTSSPSWNPWVPLGGTTLDRPVVNHYGDIYIRGVDGAVWTRYHSAADDYAPWTSLGGSIRGLPAASGRDVVTVRGTDDHVYVDTPISAFDSTYHGWVGIGGSTTDTPAIVDTDTGSLVTIRGLDGSVWGAGIDTDGSLSGSWTSLGGSVIGTPVFSQPLVWARTATNDVWGVSFPAWYPTPAKFVDTMAGSAFGVVGRGTDNQPYVVMVSSPSFAVIPLGGSTLSPVAAPPAKPPALT